MAERRAKQTGNPLVFEDPMLDMPGAEEFYTREPRMAGEEVFGSSKRMANLPLGAEEESHRPDKVNFSHPRGSGRAVRARPVQMPIILKETEDDTIVHDIHHEPQPESIPASPPNEGGIRHVSAVEETKVDVKEWHISKLSKTSAKCCWP
jgi:hypothetical protein